MTETRCPQCGATFSCGAEQSSCWCGDVPRLLPADSAAPCVCRGCMLRDLRQEIAEFMESVTPANAIAAAERAQRCATPGDLIEGLDYEMEGESFVLSAWFLLKRGECCENRCRNCPYGYGR